MPLNARSLAVAAVLCFAALPMAWAQSPALSVNVQMETSGEISIRLWPPQRAELQRAPLLAELIRCQGRMTSEADRFGEFRCASGLRRNGLSLEGAVDLAPIAREMAASDQIQLRLDYPRLGFELSSMPMKYEGGRMRVVQSIQFEAGAPPPPIHVQFGYRRGQLTGVYLPLAVMALALALIAIILSRAGLASLNLSAFLLGTMFWMGAASRLQAGEPLRILLFGTPFANLAAVLVTFLPPLLCVAAGVALGSAKRAGRKPGEMFGEVFWTYAIFLLPLTCAIGALPSMMANDWLGAASWIVAVPFVFFVCLWRIRSAAGGSVKQVSGGELKERVSALAARAGRPKVKLFIVFPAHSQTLNAFALPGRSIFLTAPLARTFSKREVQAVAAHELSHFRHGSNRPWTALLVAMVLFQTPLSESFLPGVGGLLIAMLAPVAVYFAALAGARKHEFAADAGAAVLTGDPRALISALARISRSNRRPLELNAVVEWFSSHPSTFKRIRALAALGGLSANDAAALSSSDDPGEPYTLPPDESGAVFTPRWQQLNAGAYGWAMLIGSGGGGLLVAWLLSRFAGAGAIPLLIGIAIGCAIPKALTATVMAGNYARLRRRLSAKLGVSGQLVGFAVDSAPRLYNGRRFVDAGLLWFEGGRLCYRSEQTSIALNPADVVETGLVAASPANLLRRVPMVTFRFPGCGEVSAFILHPVQWLPGRRSLLRAIERWRTAQTSAEATSIAGFNAVAGEPVRNPTIAQAVWSFRFSAAAILAAGVSSVWIFHAPWRFVWNALAIAACAHIFMFLPSLLYRPPSNSSLPATQAGAT